MVNKFATLNRFEKHYRNVMMYAPVMLGNDAVNFFLDSFKRQGWQGSYMQPWRARRSNTRRNRGRALLIQTGRLKRSIRVTGTTGGVVRIGTDVPYAKTHNEGFRGEVQVKAHQRLQYSKHSILSGKFTKKGKERMKTVQRLSGSIQIEAHTRRVNIVKRQFMGNSPYLTNILKRRLMAEIKKGLR